jgi:PPOX class probable F420-dependent enzyme
MTIDALEKYGDLLAKKALGVIATTMPDGSPQATPVWFDYSDGFFRVNSAKGRQKDLNMRARPKISLTVVDPENPYRYMEVRGKVVEVIEKGGAEHIDELSKKYLGLDKYPYSQEGEVRVIYRIKPERIVPWG